MKLKKKNWFINNLFTIGIIAMLIGLVGMYFMSPTRTVDEIARGATVQPLLQFSVLKVSYTEDENELTDKERFKKMIQDEFERYEDDQDRHLAYLTDFEVFGHEVASSTHVILGRVKGVPEGVKFPQRVLVVYKTEKEEIDPWEDENKKDVYAISEVANVSLDAATSILMRIKAAGYSVTKTEVKEDSKVELLWFDDGWSDKYPVTLDWEVTLEGSEDNIITGYDGTLGVLTVKPIPEVSYGEMTKVRVKAGYLDLKGKFKKSDEVLKLEEEIEKLRGPTKDPESGRDIKNVTWADVRAGTVKLEQFWFLGGGTGVYLGDVEEDVGDPWSSLGWFYDVAYRGTGMKGLVLTNAHVVQGVFTFRILINEQNTEMYIVYPADLGVRFSNESNRYGTASAVLAIDGQPVVNWDCDSAIIATTALKDHKRYAAVLGDSSKVKNGEPVITAGFPLLLGKMTSRGVISNTKFSIIDAPAYSWLVKYLGHDYKWIKNTNFWADPPIGQGGVSGSGMWAVEGSEKGKVIALRNAVMGSRKKNILASEVSVIDRVTINELSNEIDDFYPLRNAEYGELFFKNSNSNNVEFTRSVDMLEDDVFKEFLVKQDSMASGLNISIPINLVKNFLVEAGVSIDGVETTDEHWEK